MPPEETIQFAGVRIGRFDTATSLLHSRDVAIPVLSNKYILQRLAVCHQHAESEATHVRLVADQASRDFYFINM